MDNLKLNRLAYLTTYRCSECLLVQNIFLKSKLNIYLICSNNHLKINRFNEEYVKNMRIDLSLLKCKICKNNNSIFYCKKCYFTFCQNCKLAHSHEYIINLENIDEEQQAKYFYECCNTYSCDDCEEKDSENNHSINNINIIEIINKKNDCLKNKERIINKVQSGKYKFFIYDNNLNPINILLNLFDFQLKLYEDIIQMSKIGKYNCILLNNINNNFLGESLSYYRKYIFDDNSIYSHLKHCEKNDLYYYYLNDNKFYSNSILEKMHKRNLIVNDKNEFLLKPIMLQNYKEINKEGRRGAFDVYYDKNNIPIIIYENNKIFIFYNLNTDEKIKELKIDQIKNEEYVTDIIYFNHQKLEYLIIKCSSKKERKIFIMNINSNKLIFLYNDKNYSNSLGEKKHSNCYINDFSCCVTDINKSFFLITSTGSHIHIFDIKLNQLRTKIICKSYINCLKFYKLNINYIIVGTENDGCLCYDFKNGKLLSRFTNGYVKDLLIEDFDNKKHIILSVGKGNFISRPNFIYMYEFYSKICIKIIQSFYDCEANSILLWNHNYLFVSVYEEMSGTVMIYDLTCEISLDYGDIYQDKKIYKKIYCSPYKIKKIRTEKYGETLIVEDNSEIIIFYDKNCNVKQNKIEDKNEGKNNKKKKKINKNEKKNNNNDKSLNKKEEKEIDINLGDLFD